MAKALLVEFTTLSAYRVHAMAWADIVGLTYESFVKASITAAVLCDNPSYMQGYGAYHPNIVDNALLQRYISEIAREYSIAYDALILSDALAIITDIKFVNDRLVAITYSDI